MLVISLRLFLVSWDKSRAQSRGNSGQGTCGSPNPSLRGGDKPGIYLLEGKGTAKRRETLAKQKVS